MSRLPSPEGAAENQNQGRSMLVQWFPQWLGWYKPGDYPEAVPSLEGQSPNGNGMLPPMLMSPTDASYPQKDQNQLEDEILNALAGSVENNSLLKRDTVFGKFDFTLKKGTLDICSGSPTVANKLKAQMQFEHLLLSIESRPRSGSHYVGLSLGSILLKDHITNNVEFPDLIRPLVKDPHVKLSSQRSSAGSFIAAQQSSTVQRSEPLFQMIYERKPLSYNTDYRLLIKSQSLDVVYNVEAIKWITDFFMKPHQVLSARRKIQAMKNKTKLELLKNWENMLEGDLSERKSWTLEIDISAPQIIFAENFYTKNGSIVVIDFGRLQLTNNAGDGFADDNRTTVAASETLSHRLGLSDGLIHRDSEDDEAFMTPCSTPPGSHASTSNSPTLCSALSDQMTDPSGLFNTASGGAGSSYLQSGGCFVINTLNEKSLHQKLYDSYSMHLTDMQVLVCKSKERWSFASCKGSSALHVLDRFSISLQVERRVVYTIDPQFPSLTLSGSLPKLVAHVNEHKISAITEMLNTISASNAQSPHKSPSMTINDQGMADSLTNDEPVVCDAPSTEEELNREASKLIILQFSIDQMSLEVQSRGRSIAELQVTGVKAGCSKRPEDTSFTLSVHGLLLVDAIQSFGPDFELLIASHRHVG